MRKITLSLLGLTAIMTVTGCKAAGNATGGGSAEKYMTPPADLIVNAKSFSIKEEKTYQIETQIRPLAAYDAKLSYVSSDESVAKVDKKGVVTGVKGGHAVISVYATDYYVDERTTPKLIENIDCYVYGKASGNKAALVNEMATYQAEHCSRPDSVRLYDYRVYDLVCNGVSQDRSEEYQTYVVSQSEGLMNYSSQEVYVNVTDGGKSYDEYGYICHTRASYASYMFHHNSSVKNVFYIASEFNAGVQTRFETMCNILDSYFTVANDYFTGALDDVLDTMFGFDVIAQYTGQLFGGMYRTDNEFAITINYTESGNDETSIEDEVRYATQLPAGIPTKYTIKLLFTMVNGYVLDFLQEQKTTFKWKGYNYSYNVGLYRRIDIIDSAEVAKYIPDISEYNNVDYYYDI